MKYPHRSSSNELYHIQNYNSSQKCILAASVHAFYAYL